MSTIDPLDLLTNKNDRQSTWLSDKVNPAVGALLGLGTACFVNWGLRKPIFSGIQSHIGLTLLGGIIGKYIDGKRNDYLAERDAVLRHYIQLHPEDFPPIERKKFADVLERWYPIR